MDNVSKSSQQLMQDLSGLAEAERRIRNRTLMACLLSMVPQGYLHRQPNGKARIMASPDSGQVQAWLPDDDGQDWPEGTIELGPGEL